MFSQWLKGEGYSRQLLNKYKASGWLESLSRGVMAIKGNGRNALVALACYNEQLGKQYCIAAHSALELEGFNHYVPMGKPTLMVAHGNDKAPSWLKTNIFDHNYILFSTDTFQYVPTSNIPIEKYSLLASSPELAFMECLLLSSKRYSLMDLYYIMSKVRREHLSQIISYVMNQEDSGNPHTFGTSGTLVYPTIDEDFDFSYRYKNTNHMIHVTTVNLNQDWEKIETRIKEIVGKR